ncbi:MAG: hypothetical protein JSU01_14655 [Bacteroidetes bacterium]|nr:hypothetical protein [Bacteroidota bacterium]
MKLIRHCILLLLFVFAQSCKEHDEVVMPFRNMLYGGERLFPVSLNNADFTFRAYVNFSTSVDRIITVSYNKANDYENESYDGSLLEIHSHISPKKGINDRKTFKEINVIPNSGFKEFVKKVDSLNLMETKSQDLNNFPLALHQPFSLYVIEIKSHGKVNQFRFNTYFPYKTKVEDQYEKVQQLIMDEFNIKLYLKNKDRSKS